MLKPFLKVLPPDEARELLRNFDALETKEFAVEDSIFRVLGERVTASEDLPDFDRSTMDGFAVRSMDTFGATESAPGLFQIIGEIPMGEISHLKVSKGEAVRISTGGALPKGSDAVVMVEQTQELDEHTVEILKAVAPFENVVRRGEDFKKGQELLRAGHRLRPQDLGLLAAMGKSTIVVHRQPSVGIVSSGDEIVPIDVEPPPGCMRDVNRYVLNAMVSEAYANPIWIGAAPDSLAVISSLISEGLAKSDLVLISGGSSMGTRDLVITAIEKHKDSEVLLHGVSVSPGKPLIIARVGSKPVFGLPGHPVSAMVCFEQFVVPLIRRLEGEASLLPFLYPTIHATLSRNVPSKEGRSDFVRVKLDRKEGILLAVPVFAKSGMISAMVHAHGAVWIDRDCEGLYKGDRVKVHLFAKWLEESIEKEYLSGHEAPGGGAADLFKTLGQEQLSGQ